MGMPVQALRIFLDDALDLRGEALSRIDGNTVAGMDACPLNMLHDTGNQDILAVAHSIYFNLFSHQIFIYQDRVFLGDLIDDANVLIHILIIDGNLHSLPAQYIGRSHQDRITQTVSYCFGLLGCKYRLHSSKIWSNNSLSSAASTFSAEVPRILTPIFINASVSLMAV